MTDDEKTERIATEIMGWHKSERGNYWLTEDGLTGARRIGFDGFDSCLYWTPSTRWDHAGMIETRMHELGYWMELKSPFYPGQPYFAGFTPHNTTGWNGVPDNQMPGDTGPAAIFEAAYATLEEVES